MLDIRQDEGGLGHLPLHYSYGLSVLTSHLIKGAPVFLTAKGMMDRDFWIDLKTMAVAHFPGVPFHYQTLRRLGLHRLDCPTLRVMTQAGGALDRATRQACHDFMSARSGRFHVMYGQTEASPRITTLSHEDFHLHPETVGTALPGGSLEIVKPQDRSFSDPDEGEVVYRGPNVMLGYADCRADLALGDVQNGELLTGDIGKLEAGGQLRLTGRSKRFAKIAGLRVNLDDIEQVAANLSGEAASIQKGDQIWIFVVCPTDVGTMRQALIELLVERFTIPRVAFRVQPVDSIPRTERGKTDYATLERLP